MTVTSLTCRSWWWVNWGPKRWKRDNPTIAKCRRRKVPAATDRPRCKRWTKALKWAQWQSRPLPNWIGNNSRWSAVVCRSWKRSWPCNCRPRWASWESRPRWRSAPSPDKSKAERNRLQPTFQSCCYCSNQSTIVAVGWTRPKKSPRPWNHHRSPSYWYYSTTSVGSRSAASRLDWSSRIEDWPLQPLRPPVPSNQLPGYHQHQHCQTTRSPTLLFDLILMIDSFLLISLFFSFFFFFGGWAFQSDGCSPRSVGSLD